MHSVKTRVLMGKAEIVVNKQEVISQVIRGNKVHRQRARELSARHEMRVRTRKSILP